MSQRNRSSTLSYGLMAHSQLLHVNVCVAQVVDHPLLRGVHEHLECAGCIRLLGLGVGRILRTQQVGVTASNSGATSTCLAWASA